MALNLYREHTNDCSQKRRVRLHSRKAEESARYGWKRCDCPIYASGTLKDGFRRKKTDHTTWPEAEAQADAWQTAGAWTAPLLPVAPTIDPEPTDSRGVTIAHGLEFFIQKCQRRNSIKAPTLRKYQTFAKQFRVFFCDQKGYVTMQQLKMGDCDLFYGSWKDGPRAAGKKLERLRKLIKIWMKQQWIANDLGVLDIQPPIGSNEPADRLPFTDDELQRIYKACDELGDVAWTNHLGTHSWSGQDAKDFIVLSIHTGLRISDVATFDTKKRLIGNDIFLRAKKNNKQLYTWVPDWVRDRLLERESKYGSRIFQVGESERLETVTDIWRRKLNRIFEMAQDGKFEQKPTPHRFRYTFVRILLERGVPVPDVAELSGDTVAIIVKHYTKWVPELQARLTAILKTAFDDRPKLVPIEKKKPA